MAVVFIALGSNLKQPQQQVTRAIEVLKYHHAIHVLAVSSLYRTAPVGYAQQADFINAVLKAETTLNADQLMQKLLDIEQTFGRERPFTNAPRVLDLDLLAYDQLIMQTPLLTLPHPRMHQRAFVLVPLAEIAPDFMLATGQTVVKCLSELGLSSPQDIAQLETKRLDSDSRLEKR